MRKSALLAVPAALAVGLLGAGTAAAAVTFDPTTGMGFVGKGDVQVPWGWNDATLQSQAGNVKFNYGETDSADYTVTCEFDTGTKHVVHHVQNTTASITDTVAYDAQSANRQNPKGKVTGFNLAAKNNVQSNNAPIPTKGDSCPGNSALGKVTDVSPADNQISDQSLYAADTVTGTGPTRIWHQVNGTPATL